MQHMNSPGIRQVYEQRIRELEEAGAQIYNITVSSPSLPSRPSAQCGSPDEGLTTPIPLSTQNSPFAPLASPYGSPPSASTASPSPTSSPPATPNGSASGTSPRPTRATALSRPSPTSRPGTAPTTPPPAPSATAPGGGTAPRARASTTPLPAGRWAAPFGPLSAGGGRRRGRPSTRRASTRPATGRSSRWTGCWCPTGGRAGTAARARPCRRTRGTPVASVPVGLDGFATPFALGLYGRQFGEAKLVRVASAMEDLFRWRETPRWHNAETRQDRPWDAPWPGYTCSRESLARFECTE